MRWDGHTGRLFGRCQAKSHKCGSAPDDLGGHSFFGQTFGVVGAVTPLINLRLDEGRLPDHMKAVPE
jgi:hypothetical protein